MLTENPHLVRTVLDAMYEGVWIIDQNALTTYANPAIASMLGYTPEEIVGTSITQFLGANRADSAMEGFRRRQRGISEKLETTIRHKQGHDVWVMVSASPIFNEEQEFLGAVAIVRDMTKRREVEDELRASEQKHRALYQAIPDIVLRMNRAGEYLEIKDPIDFDLDVPAHEFIGRTLYDVHPEELAQRLQNVIVKALDNQHPASVEFDGIINRKRHWFEARVVPFSDDEIVAVVRDVTTYRLEEARRLEFALEQERLTMLNHFVNDVSHDLRNPLSIIGTSAELIGRYLSLDQKDKIEHHLSKIHEQIKHLNQQLNTLLTVSHLGHHDGMLEISSQQLFPVIERLIEEHLSLAELRHQQLTFVCPDEAIRAMFDRLALERVMRHLLINALNYTPEAGRITISMGLDDDEVWIQVSDTGIGISKYDLKGIFEPFYRVDAARPLNTGGLGLGLSVVKTTIAKHHGSVAVESELGKGSTFTIRLPVG